MIVDTEWSVCCVREGPPPTAGGPNDILAGGLKLRAN